MVVKPGDEEDRGHNEEEVEQEVGFGHREATAEARRDDQQEDERPEDPGGSSLGEQAGERPDEPRAEEPELEMQRVHVGGAHGMEGGGVEHGDERRVRRSGQRGEEAFVEPAEEVDRLPFRDPESPGVPVVEAGQARLAEERLQKQACQGDPDSRRDRYAGL